MPNRANLHIQKESTEMMKCDFWGEVIKTLKRLCTLIILREASHENTQAALQTSPHREKLRPPTNSQWGTESLWQQLSLSMGHLWTRSCSLAEVVKWLQSWLTSWLQCREWLQSKNHPAAQKIPNPQRFWENKFSLFITARFWHNLL